MYGESKVSNYHPDSMMDLQKDKYSGFDPLMTNGDAMSVLTIKRAYLKMTERDESVGWEELTDELANTLAQIMGDNEFVKWNNSKQ